MRRKLMIFVYCSFSVKLIVYVNKKLFKTNIRQFLIINILLTIAKIAK